MKLSILVLSLAFSTLAFAQNKSVVCEKYENGLQTNVTITTDSEGKLNLSSEVRQIDPGSSAPLINAEVKLSDAAGMDFYTAPGVALLIDTNGKRTKRNSLGQKFIQTSGSLIISPTEERQIEIVVLNCRSSK